jgi:hypothetical protein
MSTDPVASATTAASTIFSNLLDFLKNKAAPTAIQTFLTSAGVNTDVATMITQAITQGGKVTLPNPQTYELGNLLNPFLPSGFQIPDQWASIKVTLVTFNADPVNQQLALSGAVSIPLSLAKLTQVDFTFALSGTGNPPAFTALLNGEVGLTNSQLSLQYNLIQSTQSLNLQWLANPGSELQLSDLSTLIDGTVPDFPDGLDLHLTKANAVIDLSNNEESVEFTAVSGASAAGFVLIDRVNKAWQLACGVALDTQISSWPCIGASFDDLDLSIDAAEVLIATGSFPSFKWPSVDEEQGSVFAAFPFNLQAGVAILAILDLTNAADGTIAKNIGGLNSTRNNQTSDQIGKLLLSAQLQTPLVPNLTASFGSCNVLKYPIDLSLSIALADDAPIFSATGSITFSRWNNLVADVALNITDDSIYGDVNVSAPPPYGLLSGTNSIPNFSITELAGLMGIDFENQELVLGFVGKFDLGTISQTDPDSNPSAATLSAMLPANGLNTTTPQPNAGELAVIVGINDDLGVVPLPDVDLLILRLTKLDLTDLINAVIANPNSDGLAALSGISLEDILFYWCDVPPGTYYLPDGTVPSPGFKIHGMVSFWGKFEVWAELEFDTSGGFTGSVFLSPINIGKVLSITGAAPPDPNPVPSTFKTGGPWLDVSTAGPNFLAGSWDITLFDIASTDLNITVNEQVFSFSITSNDPDLFTEAFVCQLTSGWTQLQIALNGNLKGDIQLPSFLNVPSVTLHLDTQYSLTLSVGLNDGTTTFAMNGYVLIGSDELNLPNLTVNVSISSFADIPNAILQTIEANAQSLFSSAISEATSLIEKWGEDVLDHIEQGIKDVVYLLLHIHHAHNYGEAWLASGNLVSGDGFAKYQLAKGSGDGFNWVRRWIPDVPTLADLQDRCKCQFVTPDPSNPSGSQLLIDSLPIDTLQVPSRIDGKIIQAEENGDLFLIATSPPDKNGVTMPGKYQVQVGAVFLTASSRDVDQTCAKSDIDQIPDNSVLSKNCTINGGGIEQDAFVDGMRYGIPDMNTVYCLEKSFQTFQALSSSTFDSIPAGPALTPASQGALLKCGDPIYLVDNNQLRQFQCMESLEAYGYDASTAQDISILQLGIMSIGGDMPESPPGQKVKCP